MQTKGHSEEQRICSESSGTSQSRGAGHWESGAPGVRLLKSNPEEGRGKRTTRVGAGWSGSERLRENQSCKDDKQEGAPQSKARTREK
jgi:hypothetical protein